MKEFSKISNEDVLRLYKEHGNAVMLAQHFMSQGISVTPQGITARLRKNFPGYKKAEKKPEPELPVAGGSIDAFTKDAKMLPGYRFVFTTAQNNTHIHENFFASLLNFCKHKDAQLVVGKITYNKNGFQNATTADKDLWYDPRLEEYFVNERAVISPDLQWGGELNVIPTAATPLSGFENYFGADSGIIPHVKVAMQSLPRMPEDMPRFLFTTGAITLRNYIQKKSGQKAEFHHTYGALYVELTDDGFWFARQLIADKSGEFYDLTERYTPDGVVLNNSVSAINWGDIHVEKCDDAVLDGAFYDADSIVKVLKPKFQFVHDLTDFSARSHHILGNRFQLARQYYGAEDIVEDNIAQSAQFLEFISELSEETIVVSSNHHDHLEKWLNNVNAASDMPNAKYWHKLNYEYLCKIQQGENVNIYEHACRATSDLSRVTFLSDNDSFVIPIHKGNSGIECGMHGHLGPNGSRGSSKGFRNIGRRVNVGHMHTPSIIDGVYTAGVTAKLDMGYNKGPTSWANSHIITYENGKRAIITQHGSRWRA